MMDDFQWIYGNDDKIAAGMDAATAVFGGELGEEINLGDWDASTNTPMLVDGTGSDGNYYIVSVAGTQNLGSGNITFYIGNTIQYSLTTNTWNRSVQAIDFTGQAGEITVDTTNFDGNLSALDDTIQKAIETIDDIVLNGDMAKSVYDTNNNGIVDNAELVNNLAVLKAVPANAEFTDTTYTIGDGGLTQINFTTALKTNYDIAYTHSQVAHAPTDAEANDVLTTLQGNVFNIADSLVQLNGTAQLPALDGSLLTGLSSGFADPMTTIGDIIIKDGTNTTTRLGVGTVGQVLESDGTNISWVNASSGGDVYLANNNVFTAAQRGTIETLTYSANITADFALSNRYNTILTGNTVIENPTNLVSGQGGVIYIEQDATGSRTTTWGTYWKFANTYTEDTSASKINIFGYEVYSSTQIVVNFLGTI